MSEEHEPLKQQAQALGLGQGKIVAVLRKYGPAITKLVLEILQGAEGGEEPTPPPS